MLLEFKGTLLSKEQKKMKDGGLSKIYALTFKDGDKTITLDGFGDNVAVGVTYERVSIELSEREWNGKKYPNLFIRNMSGAESLPDPEPNYEAPDASSNVDDDLPF